MFLFYIHDFFFFTLFSIVMHQYTKTNSLNVKTSLQPFWSLVVAPTPSDDVTCILYYIDTTHRESGVLPLIKSLVLLDLLSKATILPAVAQQTVF